ncbi:MAG TPA: DUF2071 domain-containing protein [Candidatus Xenobia bacterium]
MSIFLEAEWRHLLMLNYPVEPALLTAPPGTEIDFFEGQTFVSVVGFMFLKTRVMGVAIPLHQNFEEVNLRYYVRRGDRRGVVFVREIVPQPAIAVVARVLYNEQYIARRMRHDIGDVVRYEWQTGRSWEGLWGRPAGDPQPLRPGSLEEFITEHYWGYSGQRDGGCMEYQVEHPRWNVQTLAESGLSADVERLYGKPFVDVLSRPPASALLADGSAIVVRRGHRIPDLLGGIDDRNSAALRSE